MMNKFDKNLNTVALDVALDALFGAKGRDDAKRVYELVNNAMITAFVEGRVSRDDEVADVKKTARKLGFDEGHATALFKEAVDAINKADADLSAAKTASHEGACEETALVNAVSALG